VLYVGTKRQASEIVAEAARNSAQYYVNSRWLGGMMTNWKTISNSIQRLRKVDEILTSGGQGLTKKELLNLQREREKLDRALGGIKDMGKTPDIMFIIDTNKEAIAVEEARRLNVPVVAVLDSNSSPAGIRFPIPGNDDSLRAIQLYCDLVAGAVLDGLQAEMVASGIDVGAQEDLAVEVAAEEGAPAEAVSAEAGAEAPAAAEGAPAADAKPAPKKAVPRKPAGGPRPKKRTPSA
jgi:small subunit ribosomal protein S2